MKQALQKMTWTAGVLVLTFFAWLNVAHAQFGGGGSSITLNDPLGGQTFSQVVSNVIGFIFWDIATPLCTIMVLVGAFQMMTSAGNPEKTSQGRKTIIYAAVGFFVVLIASGIASLIKSIISGGS